MASSGRVTLSEIAQRAKTSTMAVSVVLNGARSNTRVSEETRQRILSVAAGLNYTPNAMARGLKRQRTNTIGVLFNWAGAHAIHNLYAVAVLDGIVGGAAAGGYHILLYTERWRNAEVSVPAFSDQRTDGIVVIAPAENSDVVPALVHLGLPLVLLSSATDVAGVPYVTIDNRQGVILALNHLWELGHRRISYAGHGMSRHNPRERYEAYRRWMADHELTVPGGEPMASLLANLSPGNESIPLEPLLSGPDRPTSILAFNDDLAVKVLEGAREFGLSLPEELSVVGFDDILVASLTVPKLTTVRQPLLEMGQQAAQLLIQQIERRRESSANATDPEALTSGVDAVQQAHVLAPELIIRNSTAAPPTP